MRSIDDDETDDDEPDAIPVRAIAVFDLDETLIGYGSGEGPIEIVVDFMRDLESLGIQPVIVTARTDNYYAEVRRILDTNKIFCCGEDKCDIPVWCLPLDYIGMPRVVQEKPYKLKYMIDENERFDMYQRYKTAARIILGSVQSIPVHVAVGDTPWDIHHMGKADMVSDSHSLLLESQNFNHPWYSDEKACIAIKVKMAEILANVRKEILNADSALPEMTISLKSLTSHRYHSLLNRVITALGYGDLKSPIRAGIGTVINGQKATEVAHLNTRGVPYNATLEEIYNAAKQMCDTQKRGASSLFHWHIDNATRSHDFMGVPPPGGTLLCAGRVYCQVATLASYIRREINREYEESTFNNIDGECATGDDDLVIRFCQHLHHDVVQNIDESVGTPSTMPLKLWFGDCYDTWHAKGAGRLFRWDSIGSEWVQQQSKNQNHDDNEYVTTPNEYHLVGGAGMMSFRQISRWCKSQRTTCRDTHFVD
jgi:hypothetical protein